MQKEKKPHKYCGDYLSLTAVLVAYGVWNFNSGYPKESFG